MHHSGPPLERSCTKMAQSGRRLGPKALGRIGIRGHWVAWDGWVMQRGWLDGLDRRGPNALKASLRGLTEGSYEWRNPQHQGAVTGWTLVGPAPTGLTGQLPDPGAGSCGVWREPRGLTLGHEELMWWHQGRAVCAVDALTWERLVGDGARVRWQPEEGSWLGVWQLGSLVAGARPLLVGETDDGGGLTLV